MTAFEILSARRQITATASGVVNQSIAISEIQAYSDNIFTLTRPEKEIIIMIDNVWLKHKRNG